ncbi:chitin synthase, glycosyltransferase family 2 protein [Rhodotorula toruloides]|uniref:chitin synthase n=1 Tax=Rhodotorula toruloides TaxID=5286 RepID=A0A511K8N9_RHOTO|nr:chitin synthase, glycosyltransferase family 2 protein [Rhodotorula toruloides]
MASDPRPPRQAPPPAQALHHGAQRPQREQQPAYPSSGLHPHAQQNHPRPPFTQHSSSSFSDDSAKQSLSSPPVRPPNLAYASHAPSSMSYAGGAVPKVEFSRDQRSTSFYDSASAAEVPLVGYSSGYSVNISAARGAAVTPGMTSLTVGGSGADFKRKKSLVRPDRERVDENHRLYNYRQHAAMMEAEGRGTAAVSRTGHYAQAGLPVPVGPAEVSGAAAAAAHPSHGVGAGAGSTTLRRGKSILAREEGMVNESGLNIFKRGQTLRRPKRGTAGGAMPGGAYDRGRRSKEAKKPLGAWMIYCRILTACFPAPLLRCFGFRTKDRQDAWREKIGLLSVIALCMAFVGFLTFGFTQAVCGTPALRYRAGSIEGGSMIFHGYDYDMDSFRHPAAAGISEGSNPLYDIFNAAGKDGSFLFQNVNQKCLNVITPAAGTGITHNGNEMGWYFPCNLYDQYGTSTVNLTGYAEGWQCHTQGDARVQFSQLKALGQVYFLWNDLKNTSRNLGVYDGVVLDFSLLNWLDKSQVAYPPIFDELRSGSNSSFRGRDITTLMVNSNQRDVAECLVDVIRVGFVDSVTFGCVASDVVLYVSLVVIIGVVVLRFAFAVLFGWFLSWKIGKFPEETNEQRRARANEIENWTDDIYRPAPARYRPSVPNKLQKKSMLPTTSRFSKGDLLKAAGTDSSLPSLSKKGMIGAGMRNSPPGSPGGPRASRSSTSLPMSSFTLDGLARGSAADGAMGVCPFPLADVVPQPPPDYEPFNYPLAHAILLVTAYSESVEGLRTTLDSLSTTDYPNSHKVILVIADGMVKGSGNSLTTPEIVLGMMKEFVVPPAEVEPYSYVAISDGHKRHNMAKVYAGFYSYDDNTVERSKQQRVPMLLVAKVGNPAEQRDPKPGNRGKRDSQIVLMTFLQKVMFDERMTTFEYEFFNSLWRATGVSPDRYELLLMVDADTKVFPDSVSRMVACMVHDPDIMGLCGETKIANKSDSWVTMIQVFEYFVSHHQTKAFESMFGGVTCLPGCFSMYRIKAPKGGDGYWVPILANPDIVQHYSENVVDTLHKKNLLLLGEDRYLTTLMLRTFPRRKMMFCPQAVCKTIVPDTFSVLLSQRRRWINSTVHNLFELILVPDLCGVFCFSMRFVIFMELAGTLVLPAAIAFTLYLIILAIIPGTVKPVISLILLALILGIPAVLIVITSRRWSFLGWMLIYLCSLPIWNFVLPAYAFLHMDDFSWGQTRKIAGEKAGGAGHGDKEGEFDSSHISMKRWADWERERRYKSANQSRDSSYGDGPRGNSPGRPASNRYSIMSSTDTSDGFSHPRYPNELSLPAPLAPQAISPASSQASFDNTTSAVSPPPPIHSGALSRSPVDYPTHQQAGYGDEDEADRPILQHQSPPIMASAQFNAEPDVLPLSPSTTTTSPPPASSAPFASNNPFANPTTAGQPRRGVSLSDVGPVPSSGNGSVRVVQRHSRRQSSNALSSSLSGQHRSRPSTQQSAQPSFGPADSFYSGAASGGGSISGHSSSSGGHLPPGAAPPRFSHGGQP